MNALKADAKRQSDEVKYIDSLLTEYARAFRSRLSFIEEPHYAKILDAVDRAAASADLSPGDTPPPAQIEEQKPPEAPTEPQLAESQQQIPISADLDVAMGSGGGLAGFGEVHSLTAVEAVKDEAFDVTDLEKRPEAVSQVAPAYPAELRKAKVEGSVKLVFVLTEEGRVEDPRVENSSRPEFEKPALESRVAMSTGKSEQAISTLEQIIQTEPLDGEALLLAGDYYAKNGQKEKAEFRYQSAANSSGFEADAYVKHAQLLVQSQKYAQAAELLRKAQKVKPRDNVQRYLEQVEQLARAGHA